MDKYCKVFGVLLVVFWQVYGQVYGHKNCPNDTYYDTDEDIQDCIGCPMLQRVCHGRLDKETRQNCLGCNFASTKKTTIATTTTTTTTKTTDPATTDFVSRTTADPTRSVNSVHMEGEGMKDKLWIIMLTFVAVIIMFIVIAVIGWLCFKKRQPRGRQRYGTSLRGNVIDSEKLAPDLSNDQNDQQWV